MLQPAQSNLSIGALSILVALAAVAGGAQAHEVRYIASYGDNANLCTRDAPCKTMQKGINLTPAGGELIVLDSGDFGSGASIGKSITISAVGVSATIGGPITISDAGATVVLRGLRLNGVNADPLANGIDILAAAAVHIDDLEIQAFAGDGISGRTVQLFVSNTVVRNCRFGLSFANTTGENLTVDNSRFEGNTFDGMYIRTTGAATITNSIVSGNGSYGIDLALGNANVTWTTAEQNFVGYGVNSATMTLEQSVARGNTLEGLYVTSGTALISNSVLTNNFRGISRSGGTVLTRGNNTVSGNATDVDGTITPLGGI